MNTTALKHSMALLTLTLAGTNATAGERLKFGFDASAGLEYDSNVALQDLDASSGEADTASLLAAGIDLAIAAGENGTIRLGYDISATAYQEFSEYDLTLHHFNLDLSRRGRFVDVGVTADRFDGVLDGDDYVTFTQLSPNVSRLFGSRVYLRGAYIAAEKDYEDLLSSRDADSDGVRVDAYWLLDGMDRYWAVAVQKSSEDAADPELDFDATVFNVTYGHSFETSAMTMQLKAQVRYEERNYLNDTALLGTPRRDERLRGGLRATIPFNDHVQLEADVELTDNTSNLDTAELERTTFGVALAISF